MAEPVGSSQKLDNGALLSLYQLDDLLQKACDYPLITSGIGTLHHMGMWFMQQIGTRTLHQNTNDQTANYRILLAKSRIAVQNMINELNEGDMAMLLTCEICRFNNIFVSRKLRSEHTVLLGDATLDQVYEQVLFVLETTRTTYQRNLRQHGGTPVEWMENELTNVNNLFSAIEKSWKKWIHAEPGLATLSYRKRDQALTPSGIRQYRIATEVKDSGIQNCVCVIPDSNKAAMQSQFHQIIYCTGITLEKVQTQAILCTGAQIEFLDSSESYQKHLVYLGHKGGRPIRGKVYFHRSIDQSVLCSINLCFGVENGVPLIQNVYMTKQQWNAMNAAVAKS